MKKKIVLVILLALICIMSVSTFSACGNDKPIQVLLELINPTTGEVVNYEDTIDLPAEKTPIEVRVKVKETGEYLTDYDIPENTVKGSCTARFVLIRRDAHSSGSITVCSDGYWPTLEQINEAPWGYDTYEVKLSFDCKPVSVVDPNYKYKYFAYSRSIGININK